MTWLGQLAFASLEHADRGADLAGRAVAALKAVVLEKRGLHRVQRVRRAEAFDRDDVVALVHDGERETRVDPASVDQHGARAALTVVAALLGAGQMQVLSQRVEQRRAQIELELDGLTVDRERDLPSWSARVAGVRARVSRGRASLANALGFRHAGRGRNSRASRGRMGDETLPFGVWPTSPTMRSHVSPTFARRAALVGLCAIMACSATDEARVSVRYVQRAGVASLVPSILIAAPGMKRILSSSELGVAASGQPVEIDTPTSGQLDMNFTLANQGAIVSAGTVRVDLRPDWTWGFDITIDSVNPVRLCFGCIGAQSFPLNAAYRRGPADSVWVSWGGNSIKHPVSLLVNSSGAYSSPS